MSSEAALSTLPSPVAEIAERLLSWYAGCRRDLPWRRTRDPYAIWVAETMLQQTQVTTVQPYYKRFLKRFPTMEALAQASLDEVLKVWEGLGYYGRARQLHAAAQEVVRRFRGRLPADRQVLLKLPGIGPYTAGAILSIAYGQDEPALDSNAKRVLARLYAMTDDLSRSQTQEKLWRVARALLPSGSGQAGAFNQALMDLGATICLPKRPRCPLCPLEALCQARRQGLEAQLPRIQRRRRLPQYEVAVGIVRRAENILIAKRPERGLLGGLWEFPGGKRRPGESLEACLRREIREELGIEVEVEGFLAAVHHGYSHFRVTLHAFLCRYKSGRPRARGCAAWRWVRPEKLDQYAFPVANQKVLKALRAALPRLSI